MEKKQKNEELNFLYLDQKYIKKEKKPTNTVKKQVNNKQKEVKKTSNKKEKFDLEKEIVIGLTSVPEKKKKSSSPNKKVKPNKKQNQKEKQNGGVKKTPPNKTKKTGQVVKQTKHKWIGKIVKWTVLLSALIASFIFFMMSPLFNVIEITVVNNEKITSDMIISLSEIQLGENIYKTSSSKIQKKVKQNAYIESIKVNRKLPNKIELFVKERKTTYMLEYANSYAYINNQGYILEITEQKEEVPIIIGYRTPTEEIKVGGRLQAEDLEKLETVLKIIESANGNGIYSFITKIDISKKQNYILQLETKGKTVYLGDASNLSNRMLYVKAMLEKEEGIEGEIHVEGDLNKDNAFFSEKE